MKQSPIGRRRHPGTKASRRQLCKCFKVPPPIRSMKLFRDQEGKRKRFVVHLLHSTVLKSVTPQYTGDDSPCKGPLAASETDHHLKGLLPLVDEIDVPPRLAYQSSIAPRFNCS